MKKFKEMFKQNPEPARGKSGTDPMDPWGAKAGIAEASEEQLLKQYLKSRGINPEFVSLDTKISHSKSGEYLKWRRDHEFTEDIEILEATDETELVKENHVAIAMGKMLDDESGMVLTQIEELERGCAMIRSYVGKDYEKQLPAWVQAKITLATDYMSTVGNYLVSKNEKVNEETFEEGRMKDIATDASETKRLNKMSTLQKFRADSAARAKKHDNIEKNSGGMTSAIDRLEKHMNKEEVELDEIINEVLSKDASAGDWIHDFIHSDNPKFAGKSKKERQKMALGAYYGKQKNENILDPQAATQAAAGPGEISTESQRQRSKSARIIKNLYKKKGMKEETYDFEKDDKAQSYGKKPKIKEPSADSNMKKPEARIVMSGGKTLTGEPRDEVEVDPLMKNAKPGSQTVFDKPNKK